jgi:hypothetical protein
MCLGLRLRQPQLDQPLYFFVDELLAIALVRVNPEPVLIPLDRDAEDLIEAFANAIAGREQYVGGAFVGSLGKARGQALRIACILEHLWWAADVTNSPPPAGIGKAAVGAACDLVDEYFLVMAESVLGDAAIPAADRNAATLARHLRRTKLPTFNARALRHQVGGTLREAKDMSAACEALVEAGLIRSMASRAGPPGGRPAANYEVNPLLVGEDL